MPAITAPHLLLCESCGYELTGIEDLAGHCPECGRPIDLSLPHLRTGSPWQRSPSIVSWLAVGLEASRTPRAMWKTVTIHPTRAGWRKLFVLNTLLTGALLAVAAAIAVNSTRPMLPTFAIATAITALLTWIECRGVRFFGARRKWRITRELAWTVCAHAGVGWVFGAAAALALVALSQALEYATDGQFFTATILIAPVAALAAGMLIFEFLVYFGVREMRFANR